MSVIFGLTTGKKIIIGGDKRGSTKDGRIMSDSLQKLNIINNSVCFATAGNASIEMAIMSDINKLESRDTLTGSDILDVIKDLYERMVSADIKTLYMYPFYFIIAGRIAENKSAIVAGFNKNGTIDFKEVPCILFPPEGSSLQECNNIFVRNLKLFPLGFVEKTVNDISKINSYVSPSGDKWEYDITTEIGILSSF